MKGAFSDSAILDEHTEELLVHHEDEIRRLKEERRTKAYLLPSIRKYFDICEEEKELANTASDQSRLLGRGPRDPGRLLREEKMRKRVQKEKPRVGSHFSTSSDTVVLTEIIARKRPHHLDSRMGGRRGSPFSCAWGKHVANFAQRWRWRQGKPSRRERTCGFRPATGDNTKLCTWEGHSYTRRTPSVKHGLFTVSVGAEQTAAAR